MCVNNIQYWVFPKQFTVRGSKCFKVSGCLCFIFESFVSQPGCVWSGLRLPLLYFRIMCLPGWVPLVGSPAAFALSLNHLSLGCLWSPAASALSSNHSSPSLGASGRVSGCLCIYLRIICLSGWVPLVTSPAACLWSRLRLPLLYLRIGSPAASALSSNHLSPRLGASGRVSGSLCFIFESCVSQAGCLWSGLRLPLLYLETFCFPCIYLRISLPAWVPLVWSPAAFALSSNHLSLRLGASGRVSGCLCFIFESAFMFFILVGLIVLDGVQLPGGRSYMLRLFIWKDHERSSIKE